MFSVFGCSPGKTNFEDLPKEKQAEIQSGVKANVLAPYLKEVMALAFQNNGTENFDDIVNQKKGQLEKDVAQYLAKNYPDTIFDVSKFSKLDNSKTESKTENNDKKNEYVKIPLSGFHEFADDDGGRIKIKFGDAVWKWKKYWEYLVYEATDEFLFVKVEGENVWKKPAFKSLSSVKLVTKDWYEFKSERAEQITENLKKWYGWCIECEMNPLWKAEQRIVFDIKKTDLAWSVIRFENDSVDFEI